MKTRDAHLLERLGFEGWNEMQEAALETIVKEKEVLLLAPTGSGKTFGFLRAVLQLMNDKPGVQCLILVPARELALQVEQVWKLMSTGHKVNTVYGGHSMRSEIQSLVDAPALLIGTPGRVLDHLDRNTFVTDDIKTLILDEFDKSLALGFEEEMSAIMSHLTKLSRKVLVSATNTIELPEFVNVTDPVVLDFTRSREDTPRLELKIVQSPEKDKVDTLYRLLCLLGGESTLIFCNHREAAERTSKLLKEKGIENAAFHGGLEQMEREQTLIRFRNGSIFFLVATDLAARGLDIPEVKNVIHYHLPSTMAEFTHRNGRTARMTAEGSAYIILHQEETVPKYVDGTPETIELPEQLTPPPSSEWVTLFVNGGRKDKINKVDIVGFFSKAGKLEKDELGMIEVKDHVSFAAVKRLRVKDLLKRIENEKMKGKKYKIAVAR
jgi:superfamily II DNA/RNA helicase